MSKSQGAPPKISPEQRLILLQDDLGPTVIGVTVSFTTVALIIVVLRVWTRTRMVKIFGLEDYMMVAAMIFSVGHCVAQVYQVHFGSGKHLAVLVFSQSVGLRKSLYASIIMYFASLTCTKLSILLLYLRIFPIRYMRIGIFILVTICAGYGIEGILTAIFTCVPIKAFWLVWLKINAKCVDENMLYYANAGLGIATDLLVAALPVHAIWTLHVPQKQKIALTCLMCLGIVVGVIGAIRLSALIYLANHRDDPSYHSGRTAIWTAIEINLAIICGSVPALKKLFVRFLPIFRSDHSRTPDSSLPSFVKPVTSHSDRWRFVEIPLSRKSKSQPSTMNDLEAGDMGLQDIGNLTALPKADSMEGKTGGGDVKKEFDQRSRSLAASAQSSHDDLVRQPRYR